MALLFPLPVVSAAINLSSFLSLLFHTTLNAFFHFPTPLFRLVPSRPQALAMATAESEQSQEDTLSESFQTARTLSDENPSKFSALVLAFLNLWLSVLLLVGAVIACITSWLVKFFGLQPPCTFLGCTRHSSHDGSLADCDFCESSLKVERVIIKDSIDCENDFGSRSEEAQTWQLHFNTVAASSRNHRVIRRKKSRAVPNACHRFRPVRSVIAEGEGVLKATEDKKGKLFVTPVDAQIDLDDVNTTANQKALESGFLNTFENFGNEHAVLGNEVEGNCNEKELTSIDDTASAVTESLVVKKEQLEVFGSFSINDVGKFQGKFQQEEGSADIVEEDFKDKTEVCSTELSARNFLNEREIWEMGIEPLGDHLDTADFEEGDNYSKEIYLRGGVEELREALKVERNTLSSLYLELEKERNAAAIAANEAMAMIARLQEEKAAMQMEAAHYRRLVEEKAIYDQQAMSILKEILFNREREKYALEQEVELYRERFLREDSEKKKWLSIEGQRDTETKEPVLLLEGTENQLSTSQPGEANADAVHPLNVEDDLKDTSDDEKHEKNFTSFLSKQSSYMDHWKQLEGSSMIAAFSEIDERNHGESSSNISYRSPHVLESLGSSKEEVIDFVLECLHSLEVQLRELLERRQSKYSKCGSPDSSPGNVGPLSRDFIQKEQLMTPPEINSYKQKGPSAADGKDNQVRRSSDSLLHKRSFTADLAHPLPTEKGDSFSQKYDDRLLPVHDIYEVQHKLKLAAEWGRKDAFERNTVTFSEPEAAVFPEGSSLNVEFTTDHSFEGIANARLISSQDWRDTCLTEERKIDIWGSMNEPYPISNQSVDVQQHDFQIKSAVFRDIPQMESQEYTESLNKRLQLLDVNRESLRHALSLGSLKKRELGANMLEEILQHLGEPDNSDRKTNCAWKSIRYLEPHPISSFEMHAPLIKKRRYSVGLGQDPFIPLPGTMERYNSM